MYRCLQNNLDYTYGQIIPDREYDFLTPDQQKFFTYINDTTMSRLRIAIEVQAGLIPGTPMEEFNKKFYITSDAWYKQGEYTDKPDEAELEIMQVYGLANEYMRTLWNPQRVNWVRCDWVYF